MKYNRDRSSHTSQKRAMLHVHAELGGCMLHLTCLLSIKHVYDPHFIIRKMSLHLVALDVIFLFLTRYNPETVTMSKAQLNAEYGRPSVDALIDVGHPLLNRVVDGFVKVGGVGALHAASQDAFKSVSQEEGNKNSLEHVVQQMGKEALQWGLVAGVYSGVVYGLQEARGTHDWKNAFLGGALTGATLSLTESNPRHDRVISGAITGGAVATAAEFLRNLT